MDELKQETFYDELILSNAMDMMCRACLSANGQMRSLNLLHFSDCTSIVVSEYDGLPMQLCENCSNLIDQFYKFKQLCAQSERILRDKICSNNESHLKEVKKEDFEDSYKFDSNVYPEGSDYSSDENKELPTKIELLRPVDKKEIEKKMSKKKTRKVKKSKRKKGILSKTEKLNKCDTKNKKHTLKALEHERERKIERLKCSQCNKYFLKQKTLDEHNLQEHSGLAERLFSCKICDKVLKSKHSFDVHMSNHLIGNQFKCSHCDKCLSRKGALVIHERIHSDTSKFICQFCGKSFVQIGGLKVHLLRHTGEKPHACDRCDKRFAQPRDLREHLVRHEGIKKFSCRLCPQTFFSKKLLTSHLPTHTDVKRYSCDICGKGFKSKSFIVIHKRTHTGERPYECDICSNKFMARADLRHHRMIHTGEKPNKCQICSQAFIQKSALNTHMKGHRKFLAAGNEQDDNSKSTKDPIE